MVIYAHGFGSSYRNGDQYARALAAQGYLVYCFDFRGGSESSRSEGSNLEMSVFTEQSDLEAVIAMMKERPDVDSRNIFLLGASQGGMVSAMTAADNADDIAGAVLLYPAFVLVDDARERFSSIDEAPESYRHLFMTVGRPYFEKLFDYDVYGHIQNYSKDILLIHGNGDGLAPLSYSERALEVYPSAELEVIPGTGHGFHGDAAQQAIDKMSEYFSQHLTGYSPSQNAAGQKIKMTAGRLCQRIPGRADEGVRMPAGVVAYSPVIDFSGTLSHDHYGWDDITVTAEVLIEKVQKALVPVEYARCDGCFHAFAPVGRNAPEGAKLLDDSIAFMLKHLHDQES